MFSLCGNLVFLLLVVISLGCCTLAVPLSDFYPVEDGGSIRGDDGFSYPQRPISSSRKIPFFSTLYDFIVVNANGLLSFGAYYNRIWEPHLFPKRLDHNISSTPVLAPFFADINVQRGGQIKYKNYLRTPENLPILHRATTDVKRYFPYARGFDCKMLLVATWTNVLPFCDTLCYSSANTFQVIFATNYTWSFAFFNYADSSIRWGSFTKSGTKYHAVAGYDGADNIHYHNMTGSLNSSISRIDDLSNVGVKGKFAFHVDNNVDNAPEPCEADVNCKNGGTCLPNTRLCKCPPGWKGPYCEIDVDECETDNGGCDHGCANNPGSFMCTCKLGYSVKPPSTNCTDVNECLEHNGGCSHLCNNTIGSYSCQCHPGFNLTEDGFKCADIDECLVANGGCAERCINVAGSYACISESFQVLMADNRTCIPKGLKLRVTTFRIHVHPLHSNEFIATWRARRIKGITIFYQVTCTSRTRRSTTTIYTVDTTALLQGLHYSTRYWCYVVPQTSYSRGQRSATVSQSTGPAPHFGECQHFNNEIGECQCYEGFRLSKDGETCEDVDECAVDNGGCQGTCVNLPGSFTCLCDVGLKLSTDNKSCEPDSCRGPWMYMFLPSLSQGSSKCTNPSSSSQKRALQSIQPLMMACLPVNSSVANVMSCSSGP